MFIPRKLDLVEILKHKSLLIKETLGQAKLYDLLDSQVYLELSQNPKRLEEAYQESDRIIIIDEIQKLPMLLDQVHRMIENQGAQLWLDSIHLFFRLSR